MIKVLEDQAEEEVAEVGEVVVVMQVLLTHQLQIVKIIENHHLIEKS